MLIITLKRFFILVAAAASVDLLAFLFIGVMGFLDTPPGAEGYVIGMMLVTGMTIFIGLIATGVVLIILVEWVSKAYKRSQGGRCAQPGCHECQ